MNLRGYDIIVINTSGGKDSQAMLTHLHGMAVEQLGAQHRLVAVHADLGQMEWPGTRELAEKQADLLGIPFRAIKRPQGDLLSHVKARGMWPSSTARYCTSDHKRGQVSKIITALTDEWRAEQGRMGDRPARILNCLGFRAEESPARAKRVPFALNNRLTNGKRTLYDWLPIHDWSEAKVWENIKRSGLPHHRAYDLGMPRLSCIFCIFAPRAALVLAGHHNPELLAKYVQVERDIDHTFRKDQSLADIQAAVESGTGKDALYIAGDMTGAWNM